jgi:hypothetical protein
VYGHHLLYIANDQDDILIPIYYLILAGATKAKRIWELFQGGCRPHLSELCFYPPCPCPVHIASFLQSAISGCSIHILGYITAPLDSKYRL